MEFTQTQIIFYASLWSVGFICGVSRYLRNGDYRSARHCVAVGLFSGCFCVGVILLLVGYSIIPNDDPSIPFGVAFVAGLSSREQVEAIGFVWTAFKRWFERKLNIESDIKE